LEKKAQRGVLAGLLRALPDK